MGDGGLLLALALLVPSLGAMAAFMLGGRGAARVALLSAIASLLLAILIAWVVVDRGEPIIHHVGGWSPPLGITLRADGLSVLMLLTSALVVLVATIVARIDSALQSVRAAHSFWVLVQGLSTALVAALISHDLFTFYVALELLTFAAVPLVALDGRKETLSAALRYLLFALLGSLAYLLGVGLVYGELGALDLDHLRHMIEGRQTLGVPLAAALALMLTGLAAKSALVPLHLWLPPAHAGAPPPASALLSALVVKGSFLIALRIWFEMLPSPRPFEAATVLGVCGAAAVVLGGLMALKQERLKMLIAYSTVAQLGYLFLVFPLAEGGESGAIAGGMLQAVAHALAKGAMFLGAGVLALRMGSDRLEHLRGAVRVAPRIVLAMALAGLSLIGVPPSGGFWAKWRLLTAAVDSGQWWWSVTILTGGALAVAYIWRALSVMLDQRREEPKRLQPAGVTAEPPGCSHPSPRGLWIAETMVLLLALLSLLMGLFSFLSVEIVRIGADGWMGVPGSDTP